jgi:hypothetical protein
MRPDKSFGAHTQRHCAGRLHFRKDRWKSGARGTGLSRPSSCSKLLFRASQICHSGVGHEVEALRAFYSERASTQESMGVPRVGKDVVARGRRAHRARAVLL